MAWSCLCRVMSVIALPWVCSQAHCPGVPPAQEVSTHSASFFWSSWQWRGALHSERFLRAAAQWLALTHISSSHVSSLGNICHVSCPINTFTDGGAAPVPSTIPGFGAQYAFTTTFTKPMGVTISYNIELYGLAHYLLVT